MKKIKILIMIVLITLPVYAQNVAGVCATKDFFKYSSNFQWRQLKGSLHGKESLVFNVYWKFIKVGKCISEIKGFKSDSIIF